MSEREEARAYIIAVFQVDDPEAFAEHHIRQSQLDIDDSDAAPAAVRLARHMRSEGTSGRFKPMPALVW